MAIVPAIIVTLNENLEYFGQPLNLAAGVQSLADKIVAFDGGCTALKQTHACTLRAEMRMIGRDR